MDFRDGLERSIYEEEKEILAICDILENSSSISCNPKEVTAFRDNHRNYEFLIPLEYHIEVDFIKMARALYNAGYRKENLRMINDVMDKNKEDGRNKKKMKIFKIKGLSPTALYSEEPGYCSVVDAGSRIDVYPQDNKITFEGDVDMNFNKAVVDRDCNAGKPKIDAGSIIDEKEKLIVTLKQNLVEINTSIISQSIEKELKTKKGESYK